MRIAAGRAFWPVNTIKKYNITSYLTLVFFIFILFSFLPVFSAEAPPRFSAGDKVKVLWLGKWHVCTVLEVKGSEYLIHFEDDERIFDRWIAADKVRNFTYKSGDIVLVLKENQWVSAKICGSSDLTYKVHYFNTSNEHDEWVGPDRIRDVYFKIGEKIYVFWNGDWFNAVILTYELGKYKVHYVGFPEQNDEWVTVDRMRKAIGPE
mgnify:CR=1 FL=1